MGIDLSHPDELDWMARGRRGEITRSRFTETVAAEELEREAEQTLVERTCQRLVERDFVDEPDCDDAHEVDDIVATVRRVFSEIGDERRRRIEADVWRSVERTDGVEADFVDEYETRVADRVLNAYLADQGDSDVPTLEALAD